MRRTVFAFVFALFVSTAAQAVTLKDIVDLTKAGLGDEVLLALIEVDGGVFDVDPATLKSLKGAGVSERVIVAWFGAGASAPSLYPSRSPSTMSSAADRAGSGLRLSARPHGRPGSGGAVSVSVPYPVYVSVPAGRRGGTPVMRRWAAISNRRSSRRRSSRFRRETWPTYLTAEGRSTGATAGKLRPDAWKPR